MRSKFPFLLILISIFASCSQEHKEVVIKGKLIDPSSDTIVLLKPYQDLRFDDIIEIPIVNGSFEKRVEIEYPEGYYLMLGEAKENGGGAFMPLFLEEGTIDLIIYPESDFKKNKIQGGRLNKDLIDYTAKVEEQNFENWEEQQDWTKNYIKENTSLVSYFLLLQELTSGWEIENLEPYRQSHKNLAAAFPNHPYSEITEKLIGGFDMKAGKKYIDFSAPDIEGKMVSLSEQIEGKVALINLWATWCAPCIRKSREIIPVVKEYQKKGFTVIGVAGEFKSTENLEKFLARKEFPWLNLVELDRENNLWQKYGIPRSGGGMFLVNRDGKILLKDPTAEELKVELAKLLP
ncbi:AhpC/TSA family protein [Salinimicrobium sp. CDJ15-81-2]|nr:AhpC/TSA family protein [Salinimicrobium nanhaiense]